MGWYFNNLRLRASILPSRLALLPSGTSSNEALHAELNRMFRQVQSMHQATLSVKLAVVTLSKQLAHERAMSAPTTHQMAHGTVLARTAMVEWWTAATWRAWCLELASAEPGFAKASVPLAHVRADNARQVRKAILKRPAIAKRPAITATARKRTPFTRSCTGSLRTAGVKVRVVQSLAKRPAGRV